LKKVYSFEYAIKGPAGLEGKIMLDQIRTIDKSRIGKKIASLTQAEMHEIEIILKLVLDLQ